MSDALRRGVRTFFQAFVGMLALLLIPFLNDLIRQITTTEGYELDLKFIEGVLVAAVAAGVIAVIAWAQNALEDRTSMPAVLKAPASGGVNPAPDPITSDAVKP